MTYVIAQTDVHYQIFWYVKRLHMSTPPADIVYFNRSLSAMLENARVYSSQLTDYVHCQKEFSSDPVCFIFHLKILEKIHKHPRVHINSLEPNAQQSAVHYFISRRLNDDFHLSALLQLCGRVSYCITLY